MNATIIPDSQIDAIELAIASLLRGGVIGFPTDTVYGIAVPVTSQTGIERLYQIKQRSASKPIAVLIGHISQLKAITLDFNQSAMILAGRFWPGALTVVVQRHPNLPDNLSTNQKIGVRMPNHPFVLTLLREFGPLATTSANQSGSSNPISVQDVMNELEGRIDLLIDGGPTPDSIPSTVVDCTGEDLIILREGAISTSSILNAVK